MWAGSRKDRAGDLSSGSTGLQLNLISGTGNFVVTASQLGLVTIEQVVDVHISTITPAGQAAAVIYDLAGTSTAIGGTVNSASGTTAQLRVYALGF